MDDREAPGVSVQTHVHDRRSAFVEILRRIARRGNHDANVNSFKDDAVFAHERHE